MHRRDFLFAAAVACGLQSGAWTGAEPPKKIADGVYAVERDGDKQERVMPLKDGEVLLVDHHRYQKADKEPLRYLVVHAAPDVTLDLAGEPEADRDGDEVVAIRLKLRPNAAAALAKVTRERRGRQVAIVIGGEIVTVHKVREAITNGEVQITSCSPGGATYLLKQLQGRDKPK
jgi:preprotein translocase subunit SecD